MHNKRVFSKSGITLIESLVVVAIMSVLGLAVFSTIQGGVKIWRRASFIRNDEDVRILFDKLAYDLRRIVPFSKIKFKGTFDSISFSIISNGTFSIPGEKELIANGEHIAHVTYRFDSPERSIIREESDVAGFSEKEIGNTRKVLRDVSKMRIEYYSHFLGPGTFEIRDLLEDGSLPQFIKVEVVYGKDKLNKNKFTEMIEVPIARKVSF